MQGRVIELLWYLLSIKKKGFKMKSFHKFTIFAIKISTILLFGSSLYSEIISVPAKGSPTLKEAVDSAEDGDVIILESGLHKIREPIVIKKSITNCF